MNRFRPAVFLAAFLLLLAPAVAQDEEEPRWFGATHDDMATLC